MAKEIANPLKESVGTGPYKFKERKPDQYIQLVRFDGYSPRAGEPERLCRRAQAAARRDALRAGARTPTPASRARSPASIDYADVLPVEAFDRLEGPEDHAAGAAEAVRLAGTS